MLSDFTFSHFPQENIHSKIWIFEVTKKKNQEKIRIFFYNLRRARTFLEAKFPKKPLELNLFTNFTRKYPF